MRIALAQTRSVAGDVAANIARHLALVERALPAAPELVVFPELSLTGYAPSQARSTALDAAATCLDPLQRLCDARGVALAAGAPVLDRRGPCIALILFRPHRRRQTYLKRYLHADEEPYFVSGSSPPIWPVNGIDIGLAICYELSVPAHAQRAAGSGAALYLASVAKSAAGVRAAGKRMSEIARQNRLPALLVNAVGPAEGFENAGGTAVWDHRGGLLAQLDDQSEGLLLFDTDAEQATIVALPDT